MVINKKSISNKCCSFEFPVYQRILKKKNQTKIISIKL